MMVSFATTLPLTRYDELMLKIVNLNTMPEYVCTLARWHHKEWAHLNPSSTLDSRIEKMQAYLNNQLIPTTWIAHSNELLGSAAIVKYDMATHTHLTPWLASVYVDDKYRKQGIGSKLVSKVMFEARKQGIKKLYLFTPDQQGFYSRLGWELLEQTTYMETPVSIMMTELELEK